MFKDYTKYLIIILLFQSPSNITIAKKTDHPQSAHLKLVLADFDRIVQHTLEEWDLPGVAAAIVHDDSIVFLKGYGVRRRGQPERIDSHTVFRIASLSKGFASLLTGLLVQQNILHWDDKVIKYLPGLSLKESDNTQNLTIHHILSHTSGLVPHAFDNLIEANVSYMKIIKELKEASVVASVGEQYGYQNVVYSLIGDIIESATGKKYEDLIHERIFEPLGMRDASIGWDPLISEPNRASPHIRRYNHWTPVQDKKAYYSVLPAAGVNASICDMAQWLRAQMGGMSQVIPPEILTTLQIPVIRTRGEMRRYYWTGRLRDAHYGLGWRIFDYAGHTMITHSGGIRGYLAQMAFIPEKDIGIVVLYNSRRIDFLLPTFFDLYLKLDIMHAIGQ